ncbi:hypothetical protein [Tropicibacter sp. Alg240-R139]|uniref:COG3904 family protein n=1 Tax=Tropicibacter sp. Alg240-R139 TaxID=2305991 RepID=UPI0013E0590F|nr:hypothetical protein [Tropicibacter sp. Alg240-R139]
MRTNPTSASLPHVFWLWVALPRMAILGALALIGASVTLPALILYPLLTVDIVIFGWQVVCFQRSADAHVAGHGGMAAVWGGYLALLVAAGLGVATWWGLTLDAHAPPEQELFTDRMDREHAATYRLELSQDGTTLMFEGAITFGLTRRATALADSAPHLQRVTLDSPGGHIYEARGFAKLIRQRRFDTQAAGDCSSACTLPFVAGHRRSLAPGARLGFHQYALNFDNALPQIDLKKEQDKDRALFRDQGVSQTFLDTMFNAPSTGLWYLANSEARDAGLVTP